MKKIITLFLLLVSGIYFQTSAQITNVITYAGTGVAGLFDAPIATAKFRQPYGLCSDSLGNIYVADTYNHCIRKISGGNVTTIVGNGTIGDVDANGTNAQLNYPTGVFYKYGILYICDDLNNKIKKMDALGNVTTIAGSGAWSYQDGPAAQAAFKEPKSITVANNGDIFVADYENHCIRKISNGQVTTYAGVGGVSGDVLGASSTAKFYRPRDLVLDLAGNLYVTDLMNNKIKVVTTGGIVNLIAGSGAQGSADGNGIGASFYGPCGIDRRQNGDLIVLDAVGPKVRVVTTAGIVTTLAGTGSSGYHDGPVMTATFNLPQDICYDPQGNLFISDDLNHVIRKLVNINPKGVEEFSSYVNLSFFPNPSSDQVTIIQPEEGENNIKTVSVFDCTGKLSMVIEVTDENAEIVISVADLPAGIYFIIAESEKQRSIGKLIRE
jgi:precorrin-6B methylase 1